jgi:hypothetical protein
MPHSSADLPGGQTCHCEEKVVWHITSLQPRHEGRDMEYGVRDIMNESKVQIDQFCKQGRVDLSSVGTLEDTIGRILLDLSVVPAVVPFLQTASCRAVHTPAAGVG